VAAQANSPNAIEAEAKSLWELLDALRGGLQVDEALELSLAVAVIAKVSPESFSKLYKEPKAALKDLLERLLASDSKLKQLGSLECLKAKHVTPDMLQKFIYAAHEIKNYSAFANAAIEGIAHYSGRGGGEHLTDAAVVQLIKKLAGNTKRSVVYDAAAGLAHLAAELDCKELRLEDVNVKSRDVGNNILILKGIEAHYESNNSLLKPMTAAQADLVITQPPFALRLNPKDLHELESAPYLQFGAGEKIPATAGDALWIQHTLFNMNEEGRAIMLLPHGWLFRGGYDARLREYLLDNDLIEVIIGLPAGLLQNTNIQTMLLILNKNKSDQLRGTVHFVDASELGVKGKKRTTLKAEEIDLIAALAVGAQPEHESYKSVLLPEIHRNENDLTIRRYISREQVVEIPDLKQEKAALKAAQAAFTSTQNRLLNLLADTKSAKH